MKNKSGVSDQSLQFHKQSIRKQLLTARNNLASQELEVCNNKISKQLALIKELQTAKIIMGYLAFGQEISIDCLLAELLKQSRKVCVPIIKDKEKNLIEAIYLQSLDTVVVGDYGIRTPAQVTVCPAEEIDVILVPGVGFAQNGARLGLGKGYYDRFLPKAKNAIYIGVAADYNLLNNLPADEKDINMHYIVTETRIMKL